MMPTFLLRWLVRMTWDWPVGLKVLAWALEHGLSPQAHVSSAPFDTVFYRAASNGDYTMYWPRLLVLHLYAADRLDWRACAHGGADPFTRVCLESVRGLLGDCPSSLQALLLEQADAQKPLGRRQVQEGSSVAPLPSRDWGQVLFQQWFRVRHATCDDRIDAQVRLPMLLEELLDAGLNRVAPGCLDDALMASVCASVLHGCTCGRSLCVFTCALEALRQRGGSANARVMQAPVPGPGPTDGFIEPPTLLQWLFAADPKGRGDFGEPLTLNNGMWLFDWLVAAGANLSLINTYCWHALQESRASEAPAYEERLFTGDTAELGAFLMDTHWRAHPYGQQQYGWLCALPAQRKLQHALADANPVAQGARQRL